MRRAVPKALRYAGLVAVSLGVSGCLTLGLHEIDQPTPANHSLLELRTRISAPGVLLLDYRVRNPPFIWASHSRWIEGSVDMSAIEGIDPGAPLCVGRFPVATPDETLVDPDIPASPARRVRNVIGFDRIGDDFRRVQLSQATLDRLEESLPEACSLQLRPVIEPRAPKSDAPPTLVLDVSGPDYTHQIERPLAPPDSLKRLWPLYSLTAVTDVATSPLQLIVGLIILNGHPCF